MTERHNMTQKIYPVLIGADMNCYTLARAFHEAYGVRSYAFGRWAMGDTMYSRLVRFTAVPDTVTISIPLSAPSTS